MHKHHVITAALFVASAALWSAGMQTNATLAMVCAGAFELIGWKRLIKNRKSS